MKVIGLFRDIDRAIDKSAPFMRDIVNALTVDSAFLIGNFLTNGIGIVDIMGVTNDPLDAQNCISGGPSLYTDGVWIWRHDLSFFVKKYHILLPDEFLLYVMKNNKTVYTEQEILKNINFISDKYFEAEKKPSTDPNIPTNCL